MPQVLNRKTARPRQLRDSVYVGRPSKFGNPFYVGPGSYTRAEAIAKFEQYIRSKPELMEAARRELRGKNLVCWCAPLACHADVLLRIANEDDI